MKKLIAVLLVAFGAWLLSSCSSEPAPGGEQAQEVAGTASADAREFSYDGQDGKTALELLEENADDVGVVGDGANAYVTSINGVEALESENAFWALYVDGEAATTGAGSLRTATGETIEWRLETFS